MLVGNSLVGDFFYLDEVTLSSTSASVTFTSIPQTFSHLQIRLICRSNRSDQNGDFFQLNFNSDTGTNYNWNFLNATGIGEGGSVNSVNASFIEVNRFPGSLISANIFGAQVIDITDYMDTNIHKTVRYLGGWDGSGSGEVYFGGGIWRSTSTITSITLTNSGSRSFQPYSHFTLYGIK
jgi:hypothetical protein